LFLQRFRPGSTGKKDSAKFQLDSPGRFLDGTPAGRNLRLNRQIKQERFQALQTARRFPAILNPTRHCRANLEPRQFEILEGKLDSLRFQALGCVGEGLPVLRCTAGIWAAGG